MPFGSYATYYDLLYRDKDYPAEARFLHDLLQRHAPGARTILDLGCGTGRHAIELAALGYSVHGVDRSPEMLIVAKGRRANLERPEADRVEFSTGDIREVRLGRVFDAVVALFHVMSYQTSDEDLRASVETARVHLAAGGLFVFDFWHGPAVLRAGPQARTKQVHTDSMSLTRVAEPVWEKSRDLVHVHYSLAASASDIGTVARTQEVHTMRYLFLDGLDRLLRADAFALVASGEWLTDSAAGVDAWSAYVAARRLPEFQPSPP